jgi:hypothetical protein
LGISPRRCGARVQKRGGRQRASRPSYQPHWGFPFPLLLRGRHEREEEGGVAAAPGRGGTRPHRHNDDAPGEERATAAARRERKEPGTRSREHGPELRETFAGVNTYSTGNAYTALNTIATPPTTPSRPRLHRRPTVSTARPIHSLLPPWSSSCVGFATSRRVTVIPCLSAGHRAAELPCRDGWSSWAARALERRSRRAMNERGLDVALC